MTAFCHYPPLAVYIFIRWVVGSDHRKTALFIYRERFDIICQHHVVFHYIVYHIYRSIKHCKSVAKISESVVISRKIICGIKIQRLIRFALFVVYHHVSYAIFSCRTADPYTFVICLHSGFNVRIYLIGQARYMKESAWFRFRHIGSVVLDSPFKRVKYLLTRYSLKTGHITECMYIFAWKICEIACDRSVSDTASVHHGNINVEIHLIEKIV